MSVHDEYYNVVLRIPDRPSIYGQVKIGLCEVKVEADSVVAIEMKLVKYI